MCNKVMGSFEATREFNVQQTSLERNVKHVDKSAADMVQTKAGRELVISSGVQMSHV